MRIRVKLTIQFAILVAAILITFSTAVYYFSSSYRHQEFLERLEGRANNTAKLLIEIKEVDLKLLKIFDRNTIFLPDERVIIYNYLNDKIYDSGESGILKITINDDLINRIRLQERVAYVENNIEVVGLLYTDKYNRFVVIASAYDRYGLSKLNNLRIVILAGLFISIVLTVIAGLFYSGQALQPISAVVRQVDRITVSKLNLRVSEGNGTDEIAHLAITFNKMLERLESAFEMQKSFVSNASHELRTPLTALTGQIEVTLMKKRENDEYEKILTSLLEDIKSLNKLSNGLLELAQASTDIMSMRLINIRVDELLWQARSELIRRKPEYSVQIEFEDVPDDEDLFQLLGNEQLLKSALTNLMENGCKFSPEKQVKIILGADSERISIRFIDKGIGISEQDMKLILEPFFRAENARNYPGHGLGLSLTQKIISMHKGQMKITSEENKGTLVTVLFYHSDRISVS